MGRRPHGPKAIWAEGHMGRRPRGPKAAWAEGHLGRRPPRLITPRKEEGEVSSHPCCRVLMGQCVCGPPLKGGLLTKRKPRKTPPTY